MIKLNKQQQNRLAELKALLWNKKEQQRMANAQRPIGKILSTHNHIKKAEARAQARFQYVLNFLISRYALDQGIEQEELSNRISEDPTLLENLFAEAKELIPSHYHPLKMRV